MWDNIQTVDRRGEELVDWSIENNLQVLNNGDPTRTNRATGNGSTPDISFCGSDWSGKVNWSIGEPIGSSDHLPMSIVVNSNVQHQSVFGKQAKWKTVGVDWEAFRSQIETNIKETKG